MIAVLVVIHLMIALVMIGLILAQKTEGNAAGGGFSTSSMTQMMQPRARPNALSRATTILGISFFVTSLGLALLARQTGPAPSVLDVPAAVKGVAAPKVTDIGPPATPQDTPAAAPGTAAPAAPDGAAPVHTLDAPPAAPPAVPTVPNN